MTNLYMTMQDQAGVRPQFLGDSSRKLEGLDV